MTRPPGSLSARKLPRWAPSSQAGGSFVSEDGKTATINSAENVGGLTFVKSLLTDGTAVLVRHRSRLGR
jgi:hypothetical protein